MIASAPQRTGVGSRKGTRRGRKPKVERLTRAGRHRDDCSGRSRRLTLRPLVSRHVATATYAAWACVERQHHKGCAVILGSRALSFSKRAEFKLAMAPEKIDSLALVEREPTAALETSPRSGDYHPSTSQALIKFDREKAP